MFALLSCGVQLLLLADGLSHFRLGVMAARLCVASTLEMPALTPAIHIQ